MPIATTTATHDLRSMIKEVGAGNVSNQGRPSGGPADGVQISGLAQAVRRTGSNGPPHVPSDGGSARPLPLESNVLDVFAVGDVRSGSVKRVGGAIGEGAAVVAQLHTVLADAATASR
jgi:thioredoxin reductase (NADPH)